MPKLIFYRKQWFGNRYASLDPGYKIELCGQFQGIVMPNSQIEVEAPAGQCEITIKLRHRKETTSIIVDENNLYFIKISAYKYQHRTALLFPLTIIVGAIGKSFLTYIPLLAIGAYIFYHAGISNRLYIQVFKNEVPDF